MKSREKGPPLQEPNEAKPLRQTRDSEMEQVWISRAQAGDSTAIGLLYEKHLTTVRRLLLSILGPSDMIDDLSQDVFIQVFTSIGKFKGQSQFSTWLHRITVNTALSALRKRKHLPNPVTTNTTPIVAANQERTLYTQKLMKELYAVLETLSPKRKVAFVLFEIEQRSIAQIVSLTGSNVPTIKSRLFFARREIMKKASQNPVLLELFSEAVGETP